MKCPFLREAQVTSCQASAYRKMIVRTSAQAGDERCTSAAYADCPVVRQHQEERPLQPRCPYLHESLVQYCSAAAITKYVPYSESSLSRCNTESHRYCDLFLALARPGPAAAGMPTDDPHHGVDDIPLPSTLLFSSNHMWLDVGEDNNCHVGVDAFLMKVIGGVERLTFITTDGQARPTVVLTVHGTDLQMLFPNPIHITGLNTYLRTNPSKLSIDPYGAGWLFEGTEVNGTRTGLLAGDGARRWMEKDIHGISTMARERMMTSDTHVGPCLTDGGIFSSDILQHLTHEEILQLFNDYFSVYASSRR